MYEKKVVFFIINIHVHFIHKCIKYDGKKKIVRDEREIEFEKSKSGVWKKNIKSCTTLSSELRGRAAGVDAIE